MTTSNTNAVKVTANAQGFVVIPSENNPEFGYIRLEQITIEFVNNWMTPRKRSTIISGKVEDLKAAGYIKDQVLPGRIQVIESLDAPDVPNPENLIKKAGTQGIACKLNSDTIFRVSNYDPTGLSVDTLIQHNNQDEIKAHQTALKATEEGAKL
jgi:hypothetical protein